MMKIKKLPLGSLAIQKVLTVPSHKRNLSRKLINEIAKGLPLIAALLLSGCAGKTPVPEPPVPTETEVSVSRTETTEKTDVIETEKKPETISEIPAETLPKLPESGLIHVQMASVYKIKCSGLAEDKDIILRSEEEIKSFVDRVSDKYSDCDELFKEFSKYDDGFLSQNLLYISSLTRYRDGYSYAYDSTIYNSEKDRAIVTWHEDIYGEDNDYVEDGDHFLLLTVIDKSKVTDKTDIMLELDFFDSAPAIISETLEFRGSIYEPSFDKREVRKDSFPSDIQQIASAAKQEVQGTEECIKISETLSAMDDKGRSLWSDFEETGLIIPKLEEYIIKDLDGDGSEEYFLLYSMPTAFYKYYQAVFVSSDGVVRLPENGFGIEGELTLINYNGFSHVLLSFGVNNATMGAQIYSVSESTVRNIYSGIAVSEDTDLPACSVTEPQSALSRLCVYDEDIERYAEIAAVPLNEELAKELFESGAFKNSEYSENYSDPAEILKRFSIIGGKYITNPDLRCTFVKDEEGGFRELSCAVGGSSELCTLCTVDLTDENNIVKLD